MAIKPPMEGQTEEASGKGAEEVSVGQGFRSGFVTFVGRPNVGKSTLINAVVGEKIAIATNVAQTTRHRFRGVLDSDDAQIVLVDTPGIHKPHDALGEELNRSAIKALEDVDVIAFVLDATQNFGRGDEWVLEILKSLPAALLLIINKIDLADPEQIERQIQAASSYLSFQAGCRLSALSGEGVGEFIELLKEFLPEGPRWFLPGTKTDQEFSVRVAEIIREKVLELTNEEVPHAIGVHVSEVTEDSRRKLTSISATISVERDSQKGIVIGYGGERIRQIGTLARAELEVLCGQKVFLDLRVKLRKNWRRDLNQIRRFGYGEGG